MSSSYISDKIGRKLAYLISFAFVLAGSVIETLATTNGVFFAGKMLNGIAVGSFGTITMTYIGEVSHVQHPIFARTKCKIGSWPATWDVVAHL